MLTYAVGIVGKCVSVCKNSYECLSPVGDNTSDLLHELPSCCRMMPKLLFADLLYPKIQHAEVPKAFRMIQSIFLMYTVTLPLTRAAVILAPQHQHAAPHLCRLITGELRVQRQENPGKPTGFLNINELLLTRESPEHLPFLSSPLLCSFV